MKSTVYWILRLYTQFAALLFLILIIIYSISPPMVESPSPISTPLVFVPFIFLAIIFLLPYRLNLRNFYYQIRLIIYLLFSIVFVYAATRNIIIFGLISLDTMGSIGLMLLAICAPTSLIIFKKINQSKTSL